MQDTIDIKEYFSILKRQWKIVTVIVLVSTIFSVYINFNVLKPKYESNITLIVNNVSNNNEMNITSDIIGATRDLAVVYSEIITSRAVLEEVINNLHLNLTYDQIRDMIKVSTIKDTQIINISVENHNPTVARDIANSIPIAFSKKVNSIFNSNSVKVIDQAVKSKTPVKPRKIINISITTILSIIVGLFIVFLIEYMNTKITEPEDIEFILDIPILGVLPYEKNLK